MKTAARWHAGAASDTGLQRTINEDRVWLDEARGIFLVVDGLGGHAAGETAAATAVDVISQHLQSPAQIKDVICAANNEIFRLSEENQQWRGMACVLTLAVIEDDQVFIGHVGDSRLYLLWNGKLQKVTSDHSPVGEQEDGGLLTEEQAMHHPRRNEVFRDVGSLPRRVDDEQFIETHAFPFRDDAALLLCSDGLSDCVTSAEMMQILEQYDGDAERSAQRLVEAANAAGGRDNISVVFVAGAGFKAAQSAAGDDTRKRHATTRMRTEAAGLPKWATAALLLIAGVAIGFGLWRGIAYFTAVPAPVKEQPATPVRNVIEVNAADAHGIIDALAGAVSGDTISVPPGTFAGPLLLKDGVEILAKIPHESIVQCDPASVSEPGIAIVARSVHKAAVTGLTIAADETHPLKTGVLLVDSSVELAKMDISGALNSGIRIEGDSKPHLLENFIHNNGGAGVAVRDTAEPVLVHNQILQNGLMVNAPRPGIDIGPAAKPVLEGNVVSGNGTDEPLKTGHAEGKSSAKRPGDH
jgi:serine/threonine protein phosphatase PrpC